MDAVAADAAAVLVHILFMLTFVVLPINIRSKPLVSLSRLIADKLASSSHLVSLDKHKLSQSSFHRLLPAVVLTNTGYKLIHDDLRRQAIQRLHHEFIDESAAKCSAQGVSERDR